jgi:hypothetical protein
MNKEEKQLILANFERVMNELAGIWMDALGCNAKTRMSIFIDFNENLCLGVEWVWAKDQRGKLARIKVVGFKGKAPVNPGAVSI